jgi:hypothetical protein
VIRYLHIGYPKCASTALQSGLFALHPQFHHLGASGGGTFAPYVSDAVRNAVEADLRLAKDFMYDEARVRGVFETEFARAEKAGKRAVGLSSESMSFTMHHDVDVTQKAARLHRIFGEGTRVLIVVRNQVNLLTSLYREYVISGMALDFHDFVEAIYFNQFRSFLHDLDFLKMYRLYCGLFGRDAVHLLPYETLVKEPESALAALCRHLGAESGPKYLPEANPRLADEVIEALRRINAQSRRNCARSMLEPVGGYRFRNWFQDVLGVPPPASAFEDEEAINIRLAQAPRRVGLRGGPAILYQCNTDLWERVNALFAAANRGLEAETGLALSAMGYP